MKNQELIKRNIYDSIATKQELLKDETTIKAVVDIANCIIKAFQNGNKLFVLWKWW